MAYVNTAARPGLGFEGFRQAFRTFGDTVARRRVYRTTVTELKSLSNRDLADLGIHRSEINRLAHEAAYGVQNSK